MVLPLTSVMAAQPAIADDTSFDEAIEGMDVDRGAVTLYSDGDSTAVAITPGIFGRKLFWSAETSRYPPDALAEGGSLVGSNMIELERQGSRVLIRALSAGAVKVAGDPGSLDGHIGMNPVDIAVGSAQLGPVIAALPVIVEKDDGTLLVDLTDVFRSDIDGYSAIPQLYGADFTPEALDPERSYLAQATAFDDNLYIRAQLTFEGADSSGEAQAVSIEIGHTLAVLPDPQMEARPFDHRIGYFTTDVVAFEGPDGSATTRGKTILRQRLERPEGAPPGVIDPVEPLVYYLAPGIPNRWRSYIAQGVEDWQPAFEGAGFSNAIVARDAPTPEEDPEWAEEDVKFNVIRWLPQPFENAQGQQVHDPRSGEIISAHILIWPQVFDFFENYYFAEASGTDPDASTLPMPEATLGRLLRYVVAHEVGHTLGLRHNHKAATAYTVEELRDPAFTETHGTTSSIMSYGRFNYVAQPDDGVENLIPMVGDYDRFAIEWGYGAGQDGDALDAIAARQVDRPDLRWGAGEYPDEMPEMFDPTVQTEVIGADRIATTRLGIATLQRSLGRLPNAVRTLEDPQARMREIYDLMLSLQGQMLTSAISLPGGLIENRAPGGMTGSAYTPVPPDDQLAAISFVFGEGIDSLEPYIDPDLIGGFRPFGGSLLVEAVVEGLMDEALIAPRLRAIEDAAARDPGPSDPSPSVETYLGAITDALLADVDDIEDMSRLRKAALVRYMGTLQTIIDPGMPVDDDAKDEMVSSGMDAALATFLNAGLDDTDVGDAAQAEMDRLAPLLGK